MLCEHRFGWLAYAFPLVISIQVENPEPFIAKRLAALSLYVNFMVAFIVKFPSTHIIFGTECMTMYAVLTMVSLSNFFNVTKNSSLLYKHLRK